MSTAGGEGGEEMSRVEPSQHRGRGRTVSAQCHHSPAMLRAATYQSTRLSHLITTCSLYGVRLYGDL